MPTGSCPICSRPLQPTVREGARLEQCPEHGVWIEHGVFRVLEQRAKGAGSRGLHGKMRRAEEAGRASGWRASFGQPGRKGRAVRRMLRRQQMESLPPPVTNSEVPDGERRCPQCGEQMQAEERRDLWQQSPTVVVDVCEEHGLWLDRGELAILLQRAEQDAARIAGYKTRKRFAEAYEAARNRSESSQNAVTFALLISLLSDL